MISRDVVGKKIVHVEQRRLWNNNGGGWYIDVVYLELEDGTRIFPSVTECDGYYGIEMTAHKRKALPGSPGRAEKA